MRDPSHSPTPESLITLVGGFPERPPLDLAVLGEEGDATHVRRLVEYTTVAGERVQAFVLTPATGERPVPGALAIHQDGARRPYDCGKSEPAGVAGDPELAYGLELCRRGYVVICPDRFRTRVVASRTRPTGTSSQGSASTARDRTAGRGSS